jgi:hypothetical protein
MKYPIDCTNELQAALQLSGGPVEGCAHVQCYGRNSSVSSSEEDLWDGGGLYTWPTSAERLNIVSTSTNDTSAGTGARTVKIHGLDSTYTEISETVTLNGTSNVLTTNSYLRSHLMEVITAGSGGSNAGTVTCTQETSSLKLGHISIGLNRTMSGCHTIPKDVNGFLWGFSVCMDSSGEGDSTYTVYLKTRRINEVFQKVQFSNSTDMVKHKFHIPVQLPEKTDLILSAKGDGTDMSATIELTLVDTA